MTTPNQTKTVLNLAAAMASLVLTAASANAALVSHWKLDDAFGANPVVDSASGINAAETGSPVLGIAGKAGTAGSFPAGANYYLTADNVAYASPQYTFSLWFNPLQSGGGFFNVAASNRTGENGFILYQTNDEIQFWQRKTTGGWQAQTAPIVRGVDHWYHIAGTFDGSNKTYYVTHETAGTVSSQVLAGADYLNSDPAPNFGIGVRGDGGLPLNGGYLDDVQFYNSALTGSEIQSLFDNPGFNLENLPTVSAIPEPSTLTLLGVGLLALAFVGWRRRNS